jgi:hypothetical protein
MDLPNRHHDALLAKRSVPRQGMLIIGIDRRPSISKMTAMGIRSDRRNRGGFLMSVERATAELDWSPRHTWIQAMEELMAGLRDGAQDQTAPLARATSGPARVRELLTGIGQRR